MHAGYAAVLIIRERILAPILRAAHAEGVLDPSFTGNRTQGPVNVNWSFFVDVPVMEVVPLAEGGGMRITLQAWGPFGVTRPDFATTRDSMLEVTFTTGLDATIDDDDRLEVRLDEDALQLEEFSLEPLAGGPWQAQAQVVIDHPDFADAMVEALQARVAASPALLPPFDLSFLGAAFDGTQKDAAVLALDETIAVGIDVTHDALTTTGNPAAAEDFAGEDDVAFFTHPEVTRMRFPAVIADATETALEQGATLDSMTLTLQEGRIHVAGSASSGEGSASFSMNLVPTLCRKETIEYWPPLDWQRVYPIIKTVCHPELWFEAEDVDVDLDIPWWVDFLHVIGALFTFGIANALLAGLVAAMRENVATTVSKDQSAGIDRVQEFTLPNSTSPVIRLTANRWTLGPGGVLLGMKASVLSGASTPFLGGPDFVPIEEVATTDLSYRVGLPYGALPEDNALRVAWTLRRTDTNEVLETLNGLAADTLEFHVGVLPLEIAAVSGFSVAVRVFRTLGPDTVDVYTDLRRIRIYDRLDKSHPYVRWVHPVYVPIVRIEPDGSRTLNGTVIVRRHSHIHRTAFPGRCTLAARYSKKVEATKEQRKSWGRAADPRLYPTKLEYLDELPFGLDELVENRGELCDYCFFGGPGKTTSILPETP